MICRHVFRPSLHLSAAELTPSLSRQQNLSAKNSTGDLCISTYLVKAEKQFFKDVKKEKAKSTRSGASTNSHSPGRSPRSSFYSSSFEVSHMDDEAYPSVTLV